MIEVFKGDTTDIIYVRPGPLNPGDLIDSNWKCFVGVTDYINTSEMSAREVTDIVVVPVKNPDTSMTSDEECFMCFLTPAETLTLSVDAETTLHNWVIEVSNTTTTPPFNLESHNELYVKEQSLEV